MFSKLVLATSITIVKSSVAIGIKIFTAVVIKCLVVDVRRLLGKSVRETVKLKTIATKSAR